MSRRSHEATSESRRQVMTLAGFGIQQSEIAVLLRVDAKTLRKHYRRELDTGAIEATTRVIAALYANAVKHNNVAAQIWWTKCRAGWHEQDPNAASNGTTFVFEWAKEPQPPPTKPAPPTIEAEPEPDGDGTPLVSWAGEATEAAD